MLKRIILFWGLLLTATNTALAAITIDPSAIMDSWHSANHWEGILAGTITTGLFATLWKLKPTFSVHMNKARAIVLYFGCFIAFGFFTAEYGSVFLNVVALFLETVIDLF